MLVANQRQTYYNSLKKDAIENNPTLEILMPFIITAMLIMMIVLWVCAG